MLQLFGRQILDYFLQEGIKDVVDDPSLPLPDRVDQATATRFLELLVDFLLVLVRMLTFLLYKRQLIHEGPKIRWFGVNRLQQQETVPCLHHNPNS